MGEGPGCSRLRDRRSLLIAAGLAGSILLLEVAGGLWSGSLALLADAGHVLTDLLAMLMAYTALVLASRPPDTRRTYKNEPSLCLHCF